MPAATKTKPTAKKSTKTTKKSTKTAAKKSTKTTKSRAGANPDKDKGKPGMKAAAMLQKGLLIGLGATVKTTDRIKGVIDDLIAEGELSPSEAKIFGEDLHKTLENEKKELEKRIKAQVDSSLKKLIESMGLATKDDLKKLQRELSQTARPASRPSIGRSSSSTTRKPAAKKATAKTAIKKPAAKKPATKKTAASKATSKITTQKPTTKKPAAKKATTKKSAASKTTSKITAKKPLAKKATAKKSMTKKK